MEKRSGNEEPLFDVHYGVFLDVVAVGDGVEADAGEKQRTISSLINNLLQKLRAQYFNFEIPVGKAFKF